MTTVIFDKNKFAEATSLCTELKFQGIAYATVNGGKTYAVKIDMNAEDTMDFMYEQGIDYTSIV